jgi:hypothetical protein
MDLFMDCSTLAGLVAEVLLATVIVAFVERNDSWPERTRSGPAMRGGGWLRLRRVAEWGGWGAEAPRLRPRRRALHFVDPVERGEQAAAHHATNCQWASTRSAGFESA